MVWHDLVTEAKELLKRLSEDADKRLFSRFMRLFNALSQEYYADFTATADQTYEIKLQQFIEDILASSPLVLQQKTSWILNSYIVELLNSLFTINNGNQNHPIKGIK